MALKQHWSFLTPPDSVLIDLGAGGERVAAHIRLAFYSFIWIVPAVGLFVLRDDTPQVRIGLTAATAMLLISAGLVWLARRDRVFRWIGLLTTSFDITVVSMILVAFALAGRPHVAVNSMLVWECYLIFILATVIRFDLRLSLTAGLLAIFQYTAILLWVKYRWDVASTSLTDPAYGVSSWTIQLGRIVLMLTATALACGLVARTRMLFQVSGTDRLTGLFNRVYFDGRLADEISQASRHEAPLALTFLDLDRFKQFNDRWGHLAGDAALKHVAKILAAECREEDIVARWGGEEFVILHPRSTRKDARHPVERIRQSLSSSPLRTRDGETHICLSAGIAELPGDGTTAQELFAAADKRLLQAKREGRDRVIASG